MNVNINILLLTNNLLLIEDLDDTYPYSILHKVSQVCMGYNVKTLAEKMKTKVFYSIYPVRTNVSWKIIPKTNL